MLQHNDSTRSPGTIFLLLPSLQKHGPHFKSGGDRGGLTDINRALFQVRFPYFLEQIK